MGYYIFHIICKGILSQCFVFFKCSVFHLTFSILDYLLSTDQSLEPERLERQKKISWLKERVKALKDQESSINQEIEQFQQAIEKDKEERIRIK